MTKKDVVLPADRYIDLVTKQFIGVAVSVIHKGA